MKGMNLVAYEHQYVDADVHEHMIIGDFMFADMLHPKGILEVYTHTMFNFRPEFPMLQCIFKARVPQEFRIY